MNEIIDILKENSRTTVKDISIMLGITPKKVKESIRKLEKDKIILKYTTIINEEKWEKDKVQAFIEAKISPEREMGFDLIAEKIDKFPQVKSLYLMSGGFDFLIVVEGKSLKSVATFISEKLSTLEYINSISTHFLLKKYKENGTNMELKINEDKRLKVMP